MIIDRKATAKWYEALPDLPADGICPSRRHNAAGHPPHKHPRRQIVYSVGCGMGPQANQRIHRGMETLS